MLKELIFVLIFYNDKSVIYKSLPQTWGVWSCFQGFFLKLFLSGLPIAAPSNSFGTGAVETEF